MYPFPLKFSGHLQSDPWFVFTQTALLAHGLWTSHGCWHVLPIHASVRGQSSFLVHLTTRAVAFHGIKVMCKKDFGD